MCLGVEMTFTFTQRISRSSKRQSTRTNRLTAGSSRWWQHSIERNLDLIAASWGSAWSRWQILLGYSAQSLSSLIMVFLTKTVTQDVPFCSQEQIGVRGYVPKGMFRFGLPQVYINLLDFYPYADRLSHLLHSRSEMEVFISPFFTSFCGVWFATVIYAG